MKPSLLIIGSGYIGGELAQQAKAKNIHTYPVNRTKETNNWTADVTDLDSLQTLKTDLPSIPTTIVHCASSGRGNGIAAYAAVYRDGMKNLIQTFPESHIIYTSSTSVYGQTDGSIVTETSTTIPTKETGKILLETENLCLKAKGTVLRLAGIYGPQRSMILKNYLLNKANFEEDGSRYLNQIHQYDAVTAIIQAVTNPTLFRRQIFNVCDTRAITQLECYTFLAKTLNKALPEPVPKKLNSKRGWTHKQVSSFKLQNTGWTPKFPTFLDSVEEVLPSITVN